MLDKGRSGNEHQAPDQVQPRGAEHGPEGQQENEREVLTGVRAAKTRALSIRAPFHRRSYRQKETKP